MGNRAKTRTKKPINVIMYPIDDEETYFRSLGVAMLDITKKQWGEDGLLLIMEELRKELRR